MTGKRILCIILICMGTLSLSGCNSIYQALSDGTEKILDMADTVGDTPQNTALDIMDALNEIGGNTVLTSESSLQGERTTGIDNYVGTYSAEYEDFSKTEYLFGGVDVEREQGKAGDQDEKAFEMVGRGAPQEVKDAWMDAAKEVNANGMGIRGNGMMSHISQMMV